MLKTVKTDDANAHRDVSEIMLLLLLLAIFIDDFVAVVVAPEKNLLNVFFFFCTVWRTGGVYAKHGKL